MPAIYGSLFEALYKRGNTQMHKKTNEKLKRTILYYPYIDVPTDSWLRQALLYWDEISSIVPQSYEESALIPYSSDIEYLYHEGEFRPIRPDLIIRQPNGWNQLEQFEKELKSILSSNNFKRILPPKQERYLSSRVHVDKVSNNIFHYLKKRGLAKSDENNWDWYLFEKNTSFLYMSILAKYLADIDVHATIPGTDRKEYERLIYNARTQSNSFACLDTRFRNALPIPREDMPLSDVLNFKQRRRSELLNFRFLISDFHNKLSEAENNSQLKETVIQFKENIEKGLDDLTALMKDSKISTAVGSLKTIVKIKSPTLWGSLGVAVDQATKIADLPLEWTIPGIAFAGLIEVVTHIIDKKNEKRTALRDSSFAYLYHASEEGIIYT